MTERLVRRADSVSVDRAFSLPQEQSSIKTEDFEGAFPNDWLLIDNNGATGGEVLWATDSFLPFNGTYSAWPAGGGADGIPAGSGYPNDANSWLVYGPFDLSDAISATVDFSLWMDTEASLDFIKWMASSDGASFSGYSWSGSSGGWTSIQFDLATVSMLGQPSVYLAFLFQSNASGSAQGVFIDDVAIAKETGSPAHDLDLQVIDVDNKAYAPGSEIAIFTQVQNIGATASPSWTVHYYLSTDTDITDADTSLGYIPGLAALAPDETRQINALTYLPGVLADGDYYIGAIIETTDANPSNNVNLDEQPISVNTQPDIDVWPLSITVERDAAAPVNSTSEDRQEAISTNLADSVSSLLPQALDRGKVDVIVGLAFDAQPAGFLNAAMRSSQRASINTAQDRLLAALAGTGASEKRRFRDIPFIALRVDANALRGLERNPLVRSIEPDRISAPMMTSSNPVIGSPLAWADGWDGTGQASVVLDTGVDSTHPWLAGKIVSEACYSTNEAGVTESLCPGGVSSSTEPGSGLHCTGLSGCDHGTHVAGTIAGNDGVGPGYGVARGADLIAMQVFTKFLVDDVCGAGQSPCIRSYTSDQIAALERVLELSAGLDIASVNMSLGGGQYFDQATCDSENAATKAAFDNLLSVGILAAVSSGNSGNRDSTGAPGCISTALTVGATTDDDAIASFSNIADFVDFLAPGVDIVSSVPGGGTASKQGTSMAAPHVAGAIAVLRQYAPAAPPESIVAALASTGTLVDDTRSGGMVTGLPRINVNLALQALGNQPSVLAIRNTGQGDLTVDSIRTESTSDWLSFEPATPFVVTPGQAVMVEPIVDFNSAPSGTTQHPLIIESNDPDESPYPGGVTLTLINDVSNSPPVADAQSVETNEDTSLPITLTGSDADPDPLTFTVTSLPAHGTLTAAANDSDGSGWVYEPQADYFGGDSFTFLANDGAEDSTPAQVDITVLPVNDAPTLTIGANPSWPEGESGLKAEAGWITNLALGPANEAGQSLADFLVNVTSDPDGVLVALDVLNDGTLEYTLSGASGIASFTVAAQDDGGTANGGEDTSTVQAASIEVAGPAPVRYSVGGTVSGLEGSGLVLQNNGGDDLAITANGPFAFAAELESGSPYAVTVFSQPTNPGQFCDVSNASGTINSADVSDVTVVCQTTCNVSQFGNGVVDSQASFEACESVLVGPSLEATPNAEITVRSGLDVEFLPELRLDDGATLDLRVCGQSLCEVSDTPMPSGCHSCVDAICDLAPECCTVAFSQACVEMVDSECQLVCEQ